MEWIRPVMSQPPAGGAWMAAEMAEQPAALAPLLASRRANELRRLRGLTGVRGILLIARGSSDHAATYGRYLLEAVLGIPVSLCAPSLWTRYARYGHLQGHFAIGLSQSGRTPEIATVLELAGRAGASTLAITNEPDSPLSSVAMFTVPLGVGPERAVPATKTFMAQLLALALIAESLGGAPWPDNEPEKVPAAVQGLLDDEEPIRAVADELAHARAIVHVGGGYLYAVAQEGALKMIETTSLPVIAYSASDLLHGPIAMVGPDVPVVCYATHGPLESDMRRVAAAAAGRASSVVWVGDDPPTEATRHVRVSSLVSEELMPLLHVVRAQQLALAVSRAVGLDADQPSGLMKVTATS